MTVPYGCKLGGLGVTGNTSGYTTQTTNQALYLGGSARAGSVSGAALDATVYTPAPQLAAEVDDDDAHADTAAEDAMRISALMPEAQESTAPRITLWGSLKDAVSCMVDWLIPVPTVESALVLIAPNGSVVKGPMVSYMVSLKSDWSITAASMAQMSSPAVTTSKGGLESKDVPDWRKLWWPAPGR